MSQMRFRGLSLCVCVLLALTAGCKKKESSTEASKETARDPGKPASTTNQLSGSWYRDGEQVPDDAVGLEFAPDGKKLTLVGADGARLFEFTVEYALLENGRLRLSNPMQPMMTEVIIISMNGNKMTAKPESASEVLGSEGVFTKLDGKSIAARHQERLVELKAEREAKRQADLAAQEALKKKASDFLAKSDLAIVPTDGGGPGSFKLAMELKPEGNAWTGTGYHETANMMFARELRAQLSPAEDGKLNLYVQVGEVTGPPGAGQMHQEQFQFLVELKGDDLQITGNGQTVRAEPELAKSLTGKFAAEVKKQQEIVDAFCAKLGHFAILEGDLGVPNQPNAQLASYSLALLKVKDKDEYLFTNIQPNQVLKAEMFNQSLPLIVRDGKAFLAFSQSEVIALPTDGSDGFDASLQGRAGKMKTTRSMSLEQLQATRDKVAELVKSMSSKPLALSGTYFESYTYENGEILPVRLSLSSADGKNITGTYVADAFGIEAPISGQFTDSLLGKTLLMQVPSLKPMEGNLQNYVQQGPMTLALELVDGQPVVTGRMDRLDGANRFEFAAPGADRSKQLRALLDAHLKAGGQFQWAHTGYNSSDDIVSLTLKSDGDKLTGTAQMRKYAAPVAGEIKDENGHLVLHLTLAPVEGQRNVLSGPFELWILPFGETFQLSGKSAFQGAVVNPRLISLSPVKS